MYDAFAGVLNQPGTLPPYLCTMTPPSGASVDEAVAGAAHRSLSQLYPSQRPYFDSILEGAGGRPGTPVYDYGAAVADCILADRAGDPGAGSVTYAPSTDRGKHRPDPDNPQQGFYAPDYGAMSKGFGIRTRFELAQPPALDSAEYLTALRQVRGKGVRPDLLGALPDTIEGRTTDETLAGIYWAYDGASRLGTPPRLYNLIIRRVATRRSPGNATTPNTPAQNAQLFAFVNVVMADAGILAWDQKYIHELWRPVVGIREHDSSLGPAAPDADNNVSDDTDPQWLPLGAPSSNRLAKNFTPNFPSYPSGHATFGAAAFHITRLFYGVGGRYNQGSGSTLAADDLFAGLDFVSEEFNGVTTDNTGTVRPRHRRNFPDGFWQMIEENGRSRVYLGVHWVFDAFVVTEDDEPDLNRKAGGNPFGGVPLGLEIAEDVFDNGGGKAPHPSTVGPRAQLPARTGTRVPTFSSRFSQ